VLSNNSIEDGDKTGGMGSVPPLLSFLLMIVSGWVHRHQLIVIEFLQAENQLPKKRLRGKRIRFTDAERALLGRAARAVGRKALMKLDTIVCQDTLLRWHRQLVAQKWNFTDRSGPGRPRIMGEISELIMRMAQPNPRWGYTRPNGPDRVFAHHRPPLKNTPKDMQELC
jgi:putative transposase